MTLMKYKFEKIRQILVKEQRIQMIKPSDDPFNELSKRVKNCLTLLNLHEPTEIQRAFLDGRLDHVKNLGRSSFREIAIWLIKREIK